eukprot:CAMPEP_0119299542 /NCGR_PEP_ID=MMETSP1333-20130426/1623_1 /TAXON_ID=418940 /ORGANISM="Scyphosphaera apsteinii, Strain RCC1455" /LENGTH=382 /DNA_ID=CAMNT_0007301005 /DNA_START=18 /DNA_END=1163 /DNA_ORIENTATION=-
MLPTKSESSPTPRGMLKTMLILPDSRNGADNTLEERLKKLEHIILDQHVKHGQEICDLRRQNEEQRRQNEAQRRQQEHEIGDLRRQNEAQDVLNREILKQNQELIDRQQAQGMRQEVQHTEIMHTLKEVLALIRCQTTVLSRMLHGDSECPRYLMLLPTASPHDLPTGNAKQKYTLKFVDPVTMQTAGTGFEVKGDDDKICECDSAVDVSLCAFKLLSESSANRRLNLPTANSAADEQLMLCGAYKRVKDRLAKAELSHVTKVNKEVIAGLHSGISSLPANYIEAVQASYEAVTDLLDQLQKGKTWEDQLGDPLKCGLVRVDHPVDGTEWVHARYATLYKLKGRAILGFSSTTLNAMQLECERAAYMLQAARSGWKGRRTAA